MLWSLLLFRKNLLLPPDSPSAHVLFPCSLSGSNFLKALSAVPFLFPTPYSFFKNFLHSPWNPVNLAFIPDSPKPAPSRPPLISLLLSPQTHLPVLCLDPIVTLDTDAPAPCTHSSCWALGHCPSRFPPPVAPRSPCPALAV